MSISKILVSIFMISFLFLTPVLSANENSTCKEEICELVSQAVYSNCKLAKAGVNFAQGALPYVKYIFVDQAPVYLKSGYERSRDFVKSNSQLKMLDDMTWGYASPTCVVVVSSVALYVSWGALAYAFTPARMLLTGVYAVVSVPIKSPLAFGVGIAAKTAYDYYTQTPSDQENP